jgi:hypothetical protein
MIGEGRVLLLAGAEADLATLPQGCWIGGTVGYFATPQGGVAAKGTVFYTDFTALTDGASWRSFSVRDIHEIAADYPANGFALLVIPGFSQLLGHVAGRIMEYDGLYNVPLMGWVSAVAMAGPPATMPADRPKCFAGGPRAEDERAAVLYVSLPAHYFAQLHIANLFTPGTGPEIRFLKSGLVQDGDCLIGGTRTNLARYMAAQDIDRRLPLVADHEGALLNVAVLTQDAGAGRVIFLAPVCSALTYRFAEMVMDYEAEFIQSAAEIELAKAAHACICLLHYYFAGLAGAGPGAAPALLKLPGADVTAPVTFGQIAYTILNQTLTCLTISLSEDGFEDLPA